jgi:lysophospholipase L1-like esterase
VVGHRDGAPYDSTYPKLLENKLIEAGRNAEVLNAGVCGSDPFYNYVNLRDRLLKYKPDIILLCIGSDDVFINYRIRGGMERFKNDSTVCYRAAPWWEPIYAVSNILRLAANVIGFNETLMLQNFSESEKQKTDKDFIQLLDEFRRVCSINHIELDVIFHPVDHEIRDKKYVYDFTNIVNVLKRDKDVKVVDMLPVFNQLFVKTHTHPADYFWKIDGHHNSAGYELLARCVYDSLFAQTIE